LLRGLVKSTALAVLSAEKFALSEPTVGRAIAVVKHGTPELAAAVEAGDVSVSVAISTNSCCCLAQ
jgi:hypothetical protein